MEGNEAITIQCRTKINGLQKHVLIDAGKCHTKNELELARQKTKG